MPSTPPAAALDGAGRVRVDTRIDRLYADEERALGPREVLSLFARSWKFIREFRRLVWLKALLATISLTFFLMTPWPLKIVIDNVLDGRPLTGIPAALITPLAGHDRVAILMVVMAFFAIAALLVGMVADRAVDLDTRVQSGGLDQAGFTQNDANDGWSLWNGLFGYFETQVTLDLTQQVTQSVRTAVYRAFLKSPLSLYSDQKIGDAVFRVMHDSAAVSAVFYRAVLAPILSVVMFMLALAVLWAQFPQVSLIPELAALVLPVFAIFATLFAKLLRQQSQEMRESGSGVMAAFEERLSQVQLIKAFGQEERESQSIDRASWGSFRSTLKMLGIGLALFLVVTPMIGLLMLAALYNVMRQVVTGNLTLGDVVLLAGYGALLVRPMATLGSTWAIMQIPAAGLRRIHTVLDRLEASSNAGNSAALATEIETVEFREVSVGYAKEDPVLRSVSFELRTGEMAALAGASGAGKTTLILALPRLLEPLSGNIFFNGTDCRYFSTATIQERVGFVFQQEALFSTTIADNIRYGRLDATEDEVREAAAMAGAAEFIERLPEGYSTMLGRRGTRLSVGQKQRIAIARALIAHPDVLILDEPTAPLDSGSENNLIATLRALARTRIVLIVAHRATTLAACDRILFVEGGKLAASGTHRELAAASADYRAYLAATESEIQP